MMQLYIYIYIYIYIYLYSRAIHISQLEINQKFNLDESKYPNYWPQKRNRIDNLITRLLFEIRIQRNQLLSRERKPTNSNFHFLPPSRIALTEKRVQIEEEEGRGGWVE